MRACRRRIPRTCPGERSGGLTLNIPTPPNTSNGRLSSTNIARTPSCCRVLALAIPSNGSVTSFAAAQPISQSLATHTRHPCMAVVIQAHGHSSSEFNSVKRATVGDWCQRSPMVEVGIKLKFWLPLAADHESSISTTSRLDAHLSLASIRSLQQFGGVFRDICC
jgi:hypothetical protein